MVKTKYKDYNLFVGNALDFFAATKTLVTVKSPINGEVAVIKSLGFGTYIQVEGLTQSGGVVYDVWKTTLKRVQRTKRKVQNCLILGLGGGSAAKIVRKFWPEVNITGVDIDPIIVELGQKYLKFEEDKVKVVIGDALKLLTGSNSELRTKYDLILVDMYVGREVPKKFETDSFINLVNKRLTKEGIVVFNRLYYGEKRPEAVKFMKKLEKHFSSASPVYPEANVMYVCQN